MAQPRTRRVQDVQDGDQIEPALAGEDAGGIGHPDLIGALHLETWEAIGRDRPTVAAVGRGVSILGALPGKEALGTHEPGDAIASPRTTQRMRQPRTAVGATTAIELLMDTGPEMGVLQLPRPRSVMPLFPVVIAAARDQQRFAQPRHFVLAAPEFDSGIPLGGASERMPIDFLALRAAPTASRSRAVNAGSPLPIARHFAWACARSEACRAFGPSSPSGRARADESSAQQPRGPRCDRSRAIIPAPPLYIARCSSPVREPAS